MKRWHEEYARTYREWRKHYLVHVESNINYNRVPGRDPYKIDCVCDQQKGRFRKIKNLDCGIPRCWMCHGDKFPVREKTRKEMMADLKMTEGINELKGIE